MAALLGANIIKVKLPSAHLENPDAKKVYEKEKIDISTQAARVAHVVQSLFGGRRIVVFSGGAAKGENAVFDDARAIRDGVEREAASYLDGPAVVYEGHGRIARDSLSGLAVGGVSPSASLPIIDNHYRVSLGGESRIAGRPSVRLDIEPLDSLRYGHRLWLDRSTGLPLKRVLIDADGQIIETFQMTELDQPTLYEGAVAFDASTEVPPQPWQLGWLPTGYRSLALPQASSIDSLPLGHRLYSDGLASFSVFIEPLATPDRALTPGLHRLGVSYAAVRHLRVAGRIYQVVVMGEVPPEVLRRVAAQVEYRPAVASQPRSATP